MKAKEQKLTKSEQFVRVKVHLAMMVVAAGAMNYFRYTILFPW